jgi:preprotein translocase SecE subunit
MAVAVKSMSEGTGKSGAMSLPMASLAGALYVLASIAIVTQAVPLLWAKGVSAWLPPWASFIDAAGLIVVLLFAVGVLAFLGMTLVGPNPPRGLRAGVFTVLVWLAASYVVGSMLGRFGGWITGSETVGLAVMIIGAVAMLFWGWTILQKPKTPVRMEQFEAQGWFTTDRYKPTQGLRVRRATMLGLLVLLGSGVWVLQSHGTLLSGEKDWVLHVPFTKQVTDGVGANNQPITVITERFIPILPDVEITLPIILAALAFWISFRIVNWPTFGDFLIATEAEVNKISWATRKSVIQDTIVVLSTVFLLTIFLFGVDLLWGAVLGWDKIGILRLKPSQPAATRQADQIDW